MTLNWDNIELFGYRVATSAIELLALAICLWTVAYVLYRNYWKRDFGVEVHRRLRLTMKVDDQTVAYVPLFWPEVLIQVRLTRYWRHEVRGLLRREEKVCSGLGKVEEGQGSPV